MRFALLTFLLSLFCSCGHNSAAAIPKKEITRVRVELLLIDDPTIVSSAYAEILFGLIKSYYTRQTNDFTLQLAGISIIPTVCTDYMQEFTTSRELLHCLLNWGKNNGYNRRDTFYYYGVPRMRTSTGRLGWAGLSNGICTYSRRLSGAWGTAATFGSVTLNQLAKIGAHEVGHALGMTHYDQEPNVMHSAACTGDDGQAISSSAAFNLGFVNTSLVQMYYCLSQNFSKLRRLKKRKCGHRKGKRRRRCIVKRVIRL